MPKLATVAIALFCHQAFAQSSAVDSKKLLFDSVPINTFRFMGNGLVCKTDKPFANHACSRIGAFKIGDDFNKVTMPLGKPRHVVSRPDGVQSFIFFVDLNEAGEIYLVIDNKNGNVSAIQLTGRIPLPDISFASIQLNDPMSKVVEILGPRYTIHNVEKINGIQWNYWPFPISIEFVNEKVHSMRVTD